MNFISAWNLLLDGIKLQAKAYRLNDKKLHLDGCNKDIKIF